MSEIIIDYKQIEECAGKIDQKNKRLLDILHEIQRLINSLQGEYESDAAVEIRRKITKMESRFQQYYDQVENYATFLRNDVNGWIFTEKTNTGNAEAFIE